MSEYFGIIATAPSGSTAAMEFISGRERTARRMEELINSGHTVRLFKCTEVTDYAIATSVTVVF